MELIEISFTDTDSPFQDFSWNKLDDIYQLQSDFCSAHDCRPLRPSEFHTSSLDSEDFACQHHCVGYYTKPADYEGVSGGDLLCLRVASTDASGQVRVFQITMLVSGEKHRTRKKKGEPTQHHRNYIRGIQGRMLSEDIPADALETGKLSVQSLLCLPLGHHLRGWTSWARGYDTNTDLAQKMSGN